MVRPRRSLQVRERIILLTVGLAALVLMLAGATLWLTQSDQVDRQLDATLERTSVEFVRFAEERVDPDTGEGFTSTERLLYNAMRAEFPAEHEGIVAFLDGELTYVQETLTLDVSADHEFVRAIAPATLGDRSFISTLRTPTTEYRYAVLPIQVGEDVRGALVIAHDRTASHARIGELMRTFGWTSAGALLVAAVSGWLLAGRMLRPITELREVSATITEHDLSRRLPVRGDDDLSGLARDFNGMVDRLERAFQSQRQLLDDAGHELRTPLTIVRGHLELMDPHDPVDAADTRTLALGELDRMHRLTDDLVTLAKSESPDFVRLRQTDLGDLTAETFAHATTLGDREWELTESADGEIVVDRQRLIQAWLQLAANAVKFSDPGSRIALGSALDGDELRLWVRDSGIGISAEKIGSVFDRFSQVDGSRGGAGLGLPIVAAIAEAHGGEVEVTSTVGVGSTFLIRIPTRPGGTGPHQEDEHGADSGR